MHKYNDANDTTQVVTNNTLMELTPPPPTVTETCVPTVGAKTTCSTPLASARTKAASIDRRPCRKQPLNKRRKTKRATVNPPPEVADTFLWQKSDMDCGDFEANNSNDGNNNNDGTQPSNTTKCASNGSVPVPYEYEPPLPYHHIDRMISLGAVNDVIRKKSVIPYKYRIQDGKYIGEGVYRCSGETMFCCIANKVHADHDIDITWSLRGRRHAKQQCTSLLCANKIFVVKRQSKPATMFFPLSDVPPEQITTIGPELPRIPYAVMEQIVVTNRITIVAGAMDTGKTTNMVKLADWMRQKGKRILIITTRRSQSDNFNALFDGSANYMNAPKKNGSLVHEDYLIVCLNSLWLITGGTCIKDQSNVSEALEIAQYDLVILDEFQSVLDAVGSAFITTKNASAYSIYQLLRHLIVHTDRVVVMDGLPEDSMWTFFQDLELTKDVHIIYHALQPGGRCYEICESFKQVKTAVSQALARGENVATISNSLKMTEYFHYVVGANCTSKILLNSESSREDRDTLRNPDLHWRLKQMINANGMLGAGISYGLPTIGLLVGVFSCSSMTAREVHQLLRRIRKLKNPRVLIFVFFSEFKTKHSSSEELAAAMAQNSRSYLTLGQEAGVPMKIVGGPLSASLTSVIRDHGLSVDGQEQLVRDFVTAVRKASRHRAAIVTPEAAAATDSHSNADSDGLEKIHPGANSEKYYVRFDSDDYIKLKSRVQFQRDQHRDSAIFLAALLDSFDRHGDIYEFRPNARGPPSLEERRKQRAILAKINNYVHVPVSTDSSTIVHLPCAPPAAAPAIAAISGDDRQQEPSATLAPISPTTTTKVVDPESIHPESVPEPNPPSPVPSSLSLPQPKCWIERRLGNIPEHLKQHIKRTVPKLERPELHSRSISILRSLASPRLTIGSEFIHMLVHRQITECDSAVIDEIDSAIASNAGDLDFSTVLHLKSRAVSDVFSFGKIAYHLLHIFGMLGLQFKFPYIHGSFTMLDLEKQDPKLRPEIESVYGLISVQDRTFQYIAPVCFQKGNPPYAQIEKQLERVFEWFGFVLLRKKLPKVRFGGPGKSQTRCHDRECFISARAIDIRLALHGINAQTKRKDPLALSIYCARAAHFGNDPEPPLRMIATDQNTHSPPRAINQCRTDRDEVDATRCANLTNDLIPSVSCDANLDGVACIVTADTAATAVPNVDSGTRLRLDHTHANPAIALYSTVDVCSQSGTMFPQRGNTANTMVSSNSCGGSSSLREAVVAPNSDSFSPPADNRDVCSGDYLTASIPVRPLFASNHIGANAFPKVMRGKRLAFPRSRKYQAVLSGRNSSAENAHSLTDTSHAHSESVGPDPDVPLYPPPIPVPPRPVPGENIYDHVQAMIEWRAALRAEEERPRSHAEFLRMLKDVGKERATDKKFGRGCGYRQAPPFSQFTSASQIMAEYLVEKEHKLAKKRHKLVNLAGDETAQRSVSNTHNVLLF